MSEITTSVVTSARRGRSPAQVRATDMQRLGAWAAAVALSVYLGLSGGGYDIVVRSEIGLVIWWFVLLGVIIGVFPYARLPAAGWLAALLFGGFLVWTWLGLSWSSSHELTLDEVCRLSTYLGVFLLGLCALSVGTARPLLNGLGCGIAVVSGIAILSKLTPGLFPADTARSFYATPRLSYPFDYADGVGEYAALGLPLVMYIATSARTVLGRAGGSAAILPVLLCLAMTVSRGGIFAAVIGTVAFFALVPNRIPRLPTFAIAAVGIAVLMAALLARPALRDSIAPAPAAQRHSMLLLICVVMGVSALLQAAITVLMRRSTRPRWLYVSRRGAQAITAGMIFAATVLIVIGVAGGTARHLWNSFKLWEPSTHANQYSRLLSLAGSHRYQYWQVALKAFSSSPLHGIGSGTFRFYWEQHTTPAHAEYIVNAHSLWFETLAETGIIGGLLLVGFFVLIVVRGAVRALRTPGDQGTLIATATACVLAFCAAASFDWVWQIGVVPMVALSLASVTLTADRDALRPGANGPLGAAVRRRRFGMRGLLGAVSLLALVLIAIPLSSTIALRSSQAADHAGDLAAALADANTAQTLEPSAASPYLQRALLFEKVDEIGRASRQIALAIAHEPRDYQLWVTASRLAIEADQPARALADFRRAEALYPTSTYFTG